MEQKQQMNINIDPSVKPFYADDVAIACFIKQEKGKKGKEAKEGNVSLIFLEALGQSVVTRVTISKTTAKALASILKTNIEELEKKIDSDEEMSNQPQLYDTASSNYIG